MLCLCCVYFLRACEQLFFVHTGQTADTYWLALACIIPVGERKKAWKHIAVMTGGVFLHGGSAGSDGISYSSTSCWLCSVDSQMLLCQGAMLCPDIFTSMLELWLTWCEAQNVVFVIIIQCYRRKIAEAMIHWKRMLTVKHLIFKPRHGEH